MKKYSVKQLVVAAALTAAVVVLQMLGSFIHFGPFQVTLVLIPIVIGAATCGTGCSAWLGLVFGGVVLLNGDAAPFLAVDQLGTILTVILKGLLAGVASGLVFKWLNRYNLYLAVIEAAVVCAVTNTGVFLLGCRIFFFDTIKAWGAAEGFDNVVRYMFIGLAGGNFLFELLFNILISPAATRLLNIKEIKRLKK